MRLKHHRQIVNMLYAEWDLGKSRSGAKGKTCAWVYWFLILSEAEQIIVEKRSGNIVGICGYSKWHSKKHLPRKKFYRLMARLLINSPLVKDKQALKKYLADYDYTPRELSNRFDGEITIIIVDKKYRGRQIGDQMLTKIFELARLDNLNRLQILTDESCNFKFYERMGCKKVYEQTIPNGEPNKCGQAKTEQGFVYEKTLNDPTPAKA